MLSIPILLCLGACALELVFGALELTMLAGWIPTLDRLAVRTSTCVLDPFWFALERVAWAEN